MDHPKKVFKLRKSIVCHSSDIRCIAAYQGGFVTGSRDKQAKAFLPTKSTNNYNEVALFTGPQHFISSVTVMQQGQETLIYIGSNDENIYCYSAEAPQPLSVLSGHHGTVCALSTNERGQLISGSWDQTARVWTTKDEVTILASHEAAVWAVAFLGEMPLTGSADKKIRLFTLGGDLINTFEGHTDVVRGLLPLGADRFISAANDASVRIWTVNGQCLNTLHGHENYIYSISRLPPEQEANEEPVEFLTCSEDRTVRYWHGDEAVQTIRLPATTLWAVAALDSRNFAVAGSNGTVYVFTCDESRFASEEDIKALEQEVSKSQIPLSDLGDIKVNQLPSSEALMVEGRRDGQTKLVRDGNTVTCYQWSALQMQWIKVGDVVGAAGTTNDPSQKTTFEGKEYDFVFNVDIEDGKPPLKLPYNNGENPYEVAQQFIHRHELPQAYLDQIAQFIEKNAGAVTITQSTEVPGNVDPFTGGGSYHAGSGGLPTASDLRNNTNYDPFTGGNSYHSGGTTPAAVHQRPPTHYFPERKYVLFEQANVEGIAKKIKEFSPLVPPEVSITNEDLQLLLQLTDVQKPIEPRQIAVLKLMTAWPKSHLFPVLDLLRLSLLIEKINSELCSSKDSARLIDTLLVSAADSSSTPNQLCSLRALCNLFSGTVGEGLHSHHLNTVLKVVGQCLNSANKNVQIALATLYLNYSIYTSKEDSPKGSPQKIETLIAITSFLGRERVDPEAQFRLLVGLGNLIHEDKDLRGMAMSDEVLKMIKDFEADRDNRVRGVAMQLRSMLK